MVRVSSLAKPRPWSELTAKMVIGVVPGLVNVERLQVRMLTGIHPHWQSWLDDAMTNNTWHLSAQHSRVAARETEKASVRCTTACCDRSTATSHTHRGCAVKWAGHATGPSYHCPPPPPPSAPEGIRRTSFMCCLQGVLTRVFSREKGSGKGSSVGDYFSITGAGASGRKHR